MMLLSEVDPILRTLPLSPHTCTYSSTPEAWWRK